MPTLQWWVRFQTRFKYYVNCQEIAEVYAYLCRKWDVGLGLLLNARLNLPFKEYYSIFWRGLSAAIYWPYFFLLFLLNT